MTIEKLKEKLAFYVELRKELEAKDYSDQIEAEVEAFRLSLISKYAASTKEDLKKIDHYVELIRDLINEDVSLNVECKEEEVNEESKEQNVECSDTVDCSDNEADASTDATTPHLFNGIFNK